MKIKIYCTAQNKNTTTFYLRKDGVDYFLFSQEYRKGVQAYYSRVVTFDDAIDFSRAKHDFAILHTMKKIAIYSKYIEKHYGIAISKSSVSRRPKTYDRRVYA